MWLVFPNPQKKIYLLFFERNTGIEPASSAWEADALPMC